MQPGIEILARTALELSDHLADHVAKLADVPGPVGARQECDRARGALWGRDELLLRRRALFVEPSNLLLQKEDDEAANVLTPVPKRRDDDGGAGDPMEERRSERTQLDADVEVCVGS